MLLFLQHDMMKIQLYRLLKKFFPVVLIWEKLHVCVYFDDFYQISNLAVGELHKKTQNF